MATLPLRALAALITALLPLASGATSEAPAGPQLALALGTGASVQPAVPGSPAAGPAQHSARVEATLGPLWHAQASITGRYDTQGADPARPRLHGAALQAGLGLQVSPQARLDIGLRRGASRDMPARALVLSWQLRY